RQRREQLGREPRRRRLLGDRLRAVLAELEPIAPCRLGPRAARAVEAVLLVHREPRLAAAHEPRAGAQVLRRRDERTEAAGDVRNVAYLELVFGSHPGGLPPIANRHHSMEKVAPPPFGPTTGTMAKGSCFLARWPVTLTGFSFSSPRAYAMMKPT